jgi:phospholipase C
VDLDVKAAYDPQGNEIALRIRNRSPEKVNIGVFDRYTSRSKKLSLAGGQAKVVQWSISRSRGWYDLTITAQGDSAFTRHYIGHLENGESSISDPIMGGLV